ncbi:MAG: patatin-like phospholipase family protein [Nocardioides sp.]|nr:patatin-like phospholipase family protein [Nocardioides sp.]
MARQHGIGRGLGDDELPALVAARHPLAMVYGGGGVFGIAYTTGVATGLAAAGVPVATAPSLGTSAGSWTASGLALGLTYDDFAAVSSPRVPTRRADALVSVARQLFGEQGHPLVAASAVCVGSRRRHILDGARYPLADLVAASSAVPGLFPPHRIEGRRYLDGGMWSATSLDAAADADQVIVVAPLAGLVLGPLGQTAGLLLERELRRWRARHPESTVTLVRPDRAMARLAGLHPLALFDDSRAHDVYPLAYDQGLRVGEALSVPRSEAGPAA